MSFNFVRADRGQQFLLPPDMRDWLPEGHLALFVVDVVDQVDLSAFTAAYRDDGHGRAAYDPAVMVAVLLYAYCLGLRSSRQVERRCVEDIAFRVLSAGATPDHTTFARFRQRHQDALAGVFVDSLRLCAAAGMVRLGTVALDGTKVQANASKNANRTLEQITTELDVLDAPLQAEVARMLAEADATDVAEQAAGEGDGPDGVSGMPEALVEKGSRRARLAEAKRLLEADAAERAGRLAQRQADVDAKAAAAGREPRQLKAKPRSEMPRPDAKANVTDPASRLMRTAGPTLQGYNAQAVCTLEQIIVAAEVCDAANDVAQLEPMLRSLEAATLAAGIKTRRRPQRLVADAGYWRAENVNGSIERAPVLWIVPSKTGNTEKPRKDGSPSDSKTEPLRQAMAAKLATLKGKRLLRARSTTIEPLFGQIKHNRNARMFSRRGIDACSAEWKLLCATNNLLKLWRHTTASA